MTRIPRFFTPRLLRSGTVLLPPEASRHALKTLRLKPGDRVRLFDGEGLEVEAEILPGGKASAKAGILGEVAPLDKGLPERILVFSPPRGERLDWLIEKGTELGVTAFQPLLWERTPPRSRSPRIDRLERIAASACEQCGRARLPAILPPLSLEAFLESEIRGKAYLLDREGPPPPGVEPPGPATILAGPEGGWIPQEREALLERGFTPVGLGSLTLRIETALLAGLVHLGRHSPPSGNPGREGREGPP